ncbi:MarR family transcriptional regulator [Actinocorallia longicatena]|uniref:MarR family transcriptional regulator n=1 Tax=Actinocorallia longicatena TaxID=111803 RepID=A0ABP6QJE0_9ACTN
MGCELRDKVRRNAMWSVLLHSAAAAKVGLNATDTQCIDLLTMAGPLTPGQLAQAMSLTSGGAITALIDRLERAGFVRRVPDPSDRRRVLVEPVADQVEQFSEYFRPVADAAWERLEKYTDEERRVLIRFLDDVHGVMPDVIQELRALP